MIDVALGLWFSERMKLRPSSHVKNLSGKKFGRLSVKHLSGFNKHGSAMWRCRCDCGNVGTFKGISLRNDDTKSCGCWKREEWLTRVTKHGGTSRRGPSPEYTAWMNMRQRCSKVGHKAYKHYGGRGIKVCLRWKKFESFLEDMGHRPSQFHSLHRIENDRGYSPGNVKWSVSKIQQNARRNNHRLSFNGRVQTIAQWSVELGIEAHTLLCRVNRGWTTERALTSPLIKKGAT